MIIRNGKQWATTLRTNFTLIYHNQQSSTINHQSYVSTSIRAIGWCVQQLCNCCKILEYDCFLLLVPYESECIN